MKQYEIMLSGDLIAVSWDGELVSFSCDEFFKDVSNLITPGMQVVFNMEKVDFIDSAGMRFLLSVRQFVESNGATLTLCNSNRYVENVLRLTGYERIFNSFRRVEEFLEKRAAAPVN